jgi:hypothetical protein
MSAPINTADDKAKSKVDENNSDDSTPFNSDASAD